MGDRRVVLALCACGEQVRVRTASLSNGKRTCCGCKAGSKSAFGVPLPETVAKNAGIATTARRLPRVGHCAHPECSKPIKSRGLCESHYKAARHALMRTPCACGCGTLSIGKWAPGHMTKTFSSEEQKRRNDKSRPDKYDHIRGSGRPDVYVKQNGRHQHRRVMEEYLGRKLTFQEVVHHKNRNKHDNRLENLEILTRAEHAREHIEEMRAGSRRKVNG